MSLVLKRETKNTVGVNNMFPDAFGFCFEVANHPVTSGYESEVAIRLGMIKLVKNAP